MIGLIKFYFKRLLGQHQEAESAKTVSITSIFRYIKTYLNMALSA